MYFLRVITNDIRSAQLQFNHYSATKRLVLGALLAALAAIFQSAGGFFPGVGYVISPFATAPILLCMMISFWAGMLSYILTCLLLLIIQPSELIVFPFTTGLLGVGLGLAFSFFKKRLVILLVGAAFLTIGIAILLYILRFPVLGPAVSTTFSIVTLGVISIFACLYAWGWIEFTSILFKKIKDIIP
ncbi:hypothetical protein D1B31_01060 [Neobacillus notoginsengisoli]|uniref:Uncharacterized protein n=1 Tax=Neobacillus notoginsengisoli TaxID=1578198 RepID=A0A417YZJ6_9BACI|nr:hypothetical protein [Neobacillus notoginsengisoli]RHW43292.1 hypothetical protein D1B31_01060 [Neobacillus notoginsengisoli]